MKKLELILSILNETRKNGVRINQTYWKESLNFSREKLLIKTIIGNVSMIKILAEMMNGLTNLTIYSKKATHRYKKNNYLTKTDLSWLQNENYMQY